MPKKTPVTPYEHPKPEGFGVSSRGEDKAPQIRHGRPEVAKHWARLIVGANMDFEAAVRKGIAVDYPEATEAQIVSLSRTLEESTSIKREIGKCLEEIGCDDAALKKLIAGLWAEFFGQNDKRWAAAARLLAEITGASKASEKGKVLPTLKLAGMDEGLSRMLGNSAPTNAADDILEEYGDDSELAGSDQSDR